MTLIFSPTTAPKMQPLAIALITPCLVLSCWGCLPRLPIDVEFGLKRGNQQIPPSRSTYVTQLRRRLRFAHKKAKQVAGRQQTRYKGLYDRRCKGAGLDIGDLVLVRKTAWKGKHKIQDRWESDEYQVIGQPNPGIPVSKESIESVAWGRTRLLHRNLLLPLQGRIRQPGLPTESRQVGKRWKTSQALRRRKMKTVGCLVCLGHPR